jgi:hypothetical protein
MTYSAQTPIKGNSRGDPSKIKKYLRDRGVGRPADSDLYIDALYKHAPAFGINADVMVAQFIKEASRREPPHEPGHGVPWLHGCNPTGIGVTSDAQWRVYQFVNGTNGALAHLMQLSIYVNGLDLPPGYRIEQPYEDAPNPAPRWYTTIKAVPSRIKCATVLGDLDGMWAYPGVGYGASIGNILTRLETAGLFTGTTSPAPTPPKEPPVATTFRKHIFPGLPNPVYLPDWLPLEIKIIPSSVAGWTSGQKLPASNFTSNTFHDTGNMSSTADSEYNWARNGGRASAPGSYNWINDHRKIIVVQAFDELVGHAANHQGNISSHAGEQAGIGIDFEGSLNVAMWMHAGTLQAKGQNAAEDLFQHNHWSGKDCPGQVRRRGLWSRVETTVDARIAEIKAHIAGGDPVVDPVPKPDPTPAPTPVVNLPKTLFGTVGQYSFDPNGPVSKAWIANGNTTKRWPRLVQVVEGTTKYFVFSDGLVIAAKGGIAAPIASVV